MPKIPRPNRSDKDSSSADETPEVEETAAPGGSTGATAKKPAAKKAAAEKAAKATDETTGKAAKKSSDKKPSEKKPSEKKSVTVEKVAPSRREQRAEKRETKRAEKIAFGEPVRGPLLTPRFVLAVLAFFGGIAWLAYYYVGVRPVAGFNDEDKPNFDVESGKEGAVTGWNVMGDLQEWNYLIGFGLIILGLWLAAHKSTPLGRGRGVVVGMLFCFLVGLLWICAYYVLLTGSDPKDVPILNDLGQKNLFVGIGFMAVGFTFATKWE